jgi:hypothetical protein
MLHRLAAAYKRRNFMGKIIGLIGIVLGIICIIVGLISGSWEMIAAAAVVVIPLCYMGFKNG